MTLGSRIAGATRALVVFATNVHMFGLSQAVASAQRQEQDAKRQVEAAIAVSNRAEALCAAAYAAEDQAVTARRKATDHAKNVERAAKAEAKKLGRTEVFS
ncbi:hypothetical protein [Caulobacter phage KSC]|uniref:Uncharacterized protein n=1 Tax=Caulobacter phage KSC TaxID=3020398 RepID=A0AAF0B984_9CAUD|nr:hypothetical protein [Caulobacter phage KSC]